MSQHTNTSNSRRLDELIVIIANTRDKQAFVELFELSSSRLKAYALRCGASPSDAEEIVQECLLTVWRKAHTFNPQAASAATWLYTIVRNKRIDLARKNRFVQVQSEDLWPTPATSALEDDIVSDLDGKIARNLLESLPEEQRQVLFKVYYEGKSHSEIAKDVDLPIGTIKSRIRLAMKKLDTLAKQQVTWLIIILLTNF